ncbi:MAG: histidine kinase [Micrococcales bacterium]|nr:histidine kinase [Micrococcales bacterium]
MASSRGIAAESSAHKAVSGVVRLLAEIRLAVLLLVVVSALDDVVAVLWVLIVAPFSYVPARSWERHGQVISRSGILLACDLVVTVLVLLLVPGLLGWVYALAMATLVGVVAGWRLALVMVAPMALLVMPLGDLRDFQGWVAGAAVTAAMAAMALTGTNLGNTLRRQWRAAGVSADLEARRVATTERVRIARDMHDTVAGDLAGTILMAQVLRDHLDREDVSPGVRATAAQLVDLCSTAHGHTREAIAELRRAEHDQAAELENLCATWSARTGVTCALDVSSEIEGLEPSLFADLRAMLAELLENVRRHAGAQKVSVDIGVMDDQVVLRVTDDGRGLPAPDLVGPDLDRNVTEGHFGLAGIDERSAGRGGSVTRSTPAGGGLETVVRIPWGAVEEVTV